VDSVLRQGYPNFELVVVDDGSTDRTPQLLQRWRADERVVVLTNPENLGLVVSLNRGLSACRGELIARLDADDLASPTRLERQVAEFVGEPNLVLCATGYDRISASGELLKQSRPPRTHAALSAAMLSRNRLHHSSVMFRREAVASVGAYDPDWYPVEDYDLWLRLLELGRYCCVPTIESVYVQRCEGISATNAAMQARRQDERAATYRTDLTGRPRARGAVLQVHEIARASLAIRRRLRRRGVPTAGLNRQALRVVNHSIAAWPRPARAILVLLFAPRLALLGRLGRRRER
jgi:glycosyltransferase involved in cell wall biosynthesis